jgi:mono/diheme cytochrome c family protein
MAAGAVRSDELGAKVGLYRRHCVHCHGINGDGRGPTAAILNPYPRDYRPGVFKFKSTYSPNGQTEPTHDDLMRVLHDGVPGTAMPSFALLPKDEVEALAEYVKYLSMRGQLESKLEAAIAELDEGATLDPTANPAVKDKILEDFKEIAASWTNAKDQLMVPAEDGLPPKDRTPQQIAESVKAGRELFYGSVASCIKCHGPTALGDGQQTDYDIWSKVTYTFGEDTKKLAAEIEKQTTGLKDVKPEELKEAQEKLAADKKLYKERTEHMSVLLPARNAIPRNLREGIYRGGRRPLDIYWRVTSGIAGTPMPAAPNTLTQQQIWQLVDYVHSLPYEPASRPQELRQNNSAIAEGH